MIHHYIYKTYNPANDKYYIGRHSTSNIDDGYLGSGKWVKASIKANKLLQKEIVAMCKSKEDLVQTELKLIEEHINDPKCMNMVIHYSCPKDKEAASLESRQKMSISQSKRKHPQEVKDKISKSLLGNKRNLGKTHSEETRKLLSEINKNKIISDEHKHALKTKLKGRKFSPETIERMKIAAKKRMESKQRDSNGRFK